MQPKRTTTSLSARPRIKALDGLRAFAIVSVMLYHLRLPWLPSGHLGVVVFLVLSGYFATTAIVRVHDKTKGMGLRELLGLLWHRICRIWPSVFALVAIVGALCGVFNHVLLTKMRPDVLPALGFFSNWAFIVRGVSYFEQIGGPSPLLHLWYVSLDMQFFLAWSILLALMLRIGKVFARRTALVLAIASAVWMGVAFYLWGDASRAYYGTDTRAFSLLLGAWLAFAFPLGKVPVLAKGLLVAPVGQRRRNARGQRYRATVFSHGCGILALGTIVAAMALVPADASLYYYGGFAIVSVLAMLLAATLLAPKSFLGIVFSFPLFTYVGRRSFALYLWHYPIFQLLAADKTTTPWQMRLAAVGITFVAAELSYWLYERLFSSKQGTEQGKRNGMLAGRAVVASLTLAVAGYATFALVTVPDESLVPEEAIVSTGEAADKAREITKKPAEVASTNETAPLGASDNGTAALAAQANETVAANETIANETAANETVAKDNKDASETKKVELTDRTVVHAAKSETSKSVSDPVLIGDSVPGDADWSVRLPDALVDTYIGRRPDQAIEVMKGYLEQNVVGHVVVYAVFSNTTASAEQLEEMIDLAGDKREVFLVATVNPDGFQDQANELLRAAADGHDNVHYVDWPAVLEGHLEEYLWADATHLRPEGAVVYVDMVTRAVAQAMVDAGGTTSEE